MKESINSDKISKDYLNGNLSKEIAVDLLISLIESSDSTEIRVNSINKLKEINIKSDAVFKILENLLLSDENIRVRIATLKEMLKMYLEQSLSPLIWIIEHEKSPLVLKIIFDFFEKLDDLKYKQIKKKISKWFHKFSSNLGISNEESRFFFDLEVLFAKNKVNYEINPNIYKFFQKLSDTKIDDPWLLIKKKHVEILNLNYFNWNYVKENEDIIKSFSKLYDLKSYLKTIYKYIVNSKKFELFESIGQLAYLKKLILKRNNLENLPQSIIKLQNLKELDLSKNRFIEIPEVVCLLKLLEKLNFKNNNIQRIPESMNKFIASLKEFIL